MCLLKVVRGTPSSANWNRVLGIDFFLIVVCQFLVYPLNSHFGKVCIPSPECLFWWSFFLNCRWKSSHTCLIDFLV